MNKRGTTKAPDHVVAGFSPRSRMAIFNTTHTAAPHARGNMANGENNKRNSGG